MVELKLSNRTISTELPALVMGIVNATKDSFWEGSRGGAEEALRMADEGADIIDVGGESTRPGSEYVAGADILNDISALEDDSEMAAFCAEKEIPVILMHKRGIPSEMQSNTDYKDIFNEVNNYLLERCEFAEKAGIPAEKIIVDPGIGFGKNLDGNAALIKHIGELCGKKYKILMALSRKSCIGQITGREIPDRLAGTLAADLISVMYGAQLVRVHDVKETVDTLKVLGYINR